MKKVFVVLVCLLFLSGCGKTNVEEETSIKNDFDSKNVINSLKISAIGDCTLGHDPSFSYSKSYNEVYDQNGSKYFFANVYDVLSQDDITIANLETTFTDSTDEAVKAFNFKAPREYAQILIDGSVDIVNIANNHIYDFKEQGYNDTISTLNDYSIPFCGYDNYEILEKNGIKVGFIGYYANYNDNIYNQLDEGLNYLKSEGVDLIIVSFHWGVEYQYEQNDTQRNLGRYAIDNGADLVIGHHPHIVQGIEQYNGKYIVYSLGNFSFGGNKNPRDYDTFIFQQTFNFTNGELTDNTINIIPARLSSATDHNDYSPVILDGEEKTRVLNKILKYSENVVLE